MRRCIKDFYHHIQGRFHPQTHGPIPADSSSRTTTPRFGVDETTTTSNSIQEGVAALKHIHDAIQPQDLKRCVGELLLVLGSDAFNGSSDNDGLAKLNGELKQLAEISQSTVGPLQSAKRVQDLARWVLSTAKELESYNGYHQFVSDVSDATENVRVKLVGDSERGQYNHDIIFGLSDALHQAISKFHTDSVPTPSAPTTKQKARAVSGRIVGALTIIERSLDGVPAIGLRAAVGGLLEILRSTNRLLDNEDDLKDLVAHLQRLVEIVVSKEGSGIDPRGSALAQRLEELTMDMERIKADAETIKEQTMSGKFLGSTDNTSAIAKLTQATEQAIIRFQTAGSIRIERGVFGLQETSDRMETKVKDVEAIILSAADEATLNNMKPRSDNARYNSLLQTSASFCLPETRVAIIEEILRWAVDPEGLPIYWLYGMAGTGKSTIARTIAKRLDDQGCLGASFFFSRDEQDRQTTVAMFPTIAHQLACSHPLFRSPIITAVRNHPAACTSMMQTQLEKLIIGPLQQIVQTSPIIVVLDALDECTSESSITELLVLLAPAIKTIRSSVNIKFFLTSRPEIHIKAALTEPSMKAVSSISVLHDVEKSIVQGDIRLYLNYHLTKISRMMLPEGASWPTEQDKDKLVELAGILFIFAAVCVKYIGENHPPSPKARLHRIIGASEGNSAAHPLKHLDALYMQIMMGAKPDDEDDESEFIQQLRNIIGTIVLLFDPLSISTLERLLQIEEDGVWSALGRFHSVLSVPLNRDLPVHVFHKSFSDFLTYFGRSGKYWFYINPKEHHGCLATLCLKHMNILLVHDICGVGNALNDEIQDKEQRLELHVPHHLRYACEHWSSHLKLADLSEALEDELRVFCKSKILYWIELLSLIGRMNLVVPLLNSARDWCKVSGNIFVIEGWLYNYL
ncbi:hypothetical protein FRC03_009703 [Tulasnella sp. 419]|nr:hypothetical protein FRC03_009703 [Tulasnella sp. 419]